MPLFVDGPGSTAGDLVRIDAGLLDTAASHSIDVTARLELAHESLAGDLQLWLDRLNGLRLEQVVVNTALRNWERTQTLALVYRDAWFAELGERYRVRWDEYSRLSRNAYELFLAGGMPLVNNPVRRATPPVLGSIGGPQSGGSFYACVAWVNAAGQQGAPSATSSMDIPDGKIMTIAATLPPANATGFHIYAGTSVNGLTKRNDVPLAPDASFLYIPGSSGSAVGPGTGQVPDFTRPLRRTIPRG